MSTSEKQPVEENVVASEFKIPSAEPEPLAACTCNGVLVNNTGQTLTLVSFTNGQFMTEPPPQTIANDTQGTWVSTSAFGNGGSVTYAYNGPAGQAQITVYWSIPWVGSNQFTWNSNPAGALNAAVTGQLRHWTCNPFYIVTASS